MNSIENFIDRVDTERMNVQNPPLSSLISKNFFIGFLIGNSSNDPRWSFDPQNGEFLKMKSSKRNGWMIIFWSSFITKWALWGNYGQAGLKKWPFWLSCHHLCHQFPAVIFVRHLGGWHFPILVFAFWVQSPTVPEIKICSNVNWGS